MHNDNKKLFLSKLRDLSQSRSLHRVFSDWLEIAAISLHQLPYHSCELERDDDFDRLEVLYLERIKPYSKEELNTFAELMGLTLAEHHTDYVDFLGEVAGESGLLNAHGGQFFTPYPICLLNAKMTFRNVQQAVEEKGLITVCDPASGAGALLIASAEAIASQGVDPRACVQFDCTDVSRNAFNMTYIQLCAQNLQAVVRHGNTLSMESWEHRPTPQLRLFHQWLGQQQRSEGIARAMQLLFVKDLRPASKPLSAPLGEGQPQEPDVILNRQLDLFG